MILCCPLPYLLHAAPSGEDDDTLENGTTTYSTPAGDDAVSKTSEVGLPSHLQTFATIPAAMLPSQACSIIPSNVETQDDGTSLRTMCGSRIGGWSLPCVMSD
jgi:hypothetical protein